MSCRLNLRLPPLKVCLEFFLLGLLLHASHSLPISILAFCSSFVQPSREERTSKQASDAAAAAAAARHEGKKKGKKRGVAETFSEGRDHINALGLPNDGYDYEQHLKSMGEACQ